MSQEVRHCCYTVLQLYCTEIDSYKLAIKVWMKTYIHMDTASTPFSTGRNILCARQGRHLPPLRGTPVSWQTFLIYSSPMISLMCHSHPLVKFSEINFIAGENPLQPLGGSASSKFIEYCLGLMLVHVYLKSYMYIWFPSQECFLY